LLDRNPNPSEHEIRFQLANNLCRCTGYDKIVRAVQAAAAELRSAKAGDGAATIGGGGCGVGGGCGR